MSHITVPAEHLDLYERYLRYEATSAQLAEALGLHPVTVRNKFPRQRPPKTDKKALTRARHLWRLTLAHLPARVIAEKAHVSLSTANRIRREGKKKLCP